MRKRSFILLAFISVSLATLSQQYYALLNRDSLLQILGSAKDTQRINTLNLLSTRILFGPQHGNDQDTARQLADEALLLSNKIKYNRGIGNALLNDAYITNKAGVGNYKVTLNMLQRSLHLLKESKDSNAMVNCFSLIGEAYHGLAENAQAILFFDSSIVLSNQMKDTITGLWTTTSKAHSYADIGNYAESYKIFHDALELIPPTDTLLLAFTYCQLTQLFFAAEMPELTIEYMNKVRKLFPNQKSWQVSWSSRNGAEAYLQLNKVDSALKIASFINIPLDEQDAPDNLFYGHLNLALHDYEKALFYFDRGFKLSKRISYEIGHAMQADGLAESYFQLGDLEKAIHYASIGLKVAKEKNILQEQKKALGILSKVYAAKKDFQQAYFFSQRYKIINDSLAPEQYKQKVAILQVNDQLNIQKKEALLLSNKNELSQQQIKVQEATIKRRSLLLYIFIVALAVAGILALLIQRNIKLKRRKQQLQQLMDQVNAQQKLMELEKDKANLEMQALRAQMNPHFIFNCLSSINRFILINKIEEASDYLTKFSRLIRMVLQNSEKSLISLENELDALRLYLDLERLRFKNAFNYSITFINAIDVNAVFIPPLLIQPFAENAVWHGLMHKKETGQLDIQLSIEGKSLLCSVIDNGIGREMALKLNSRSAERTKSMGMAITSGRLALLNKSQSNDVTFYIEDIENSTGEACGTKVILTIPYKELTEVIA